MKQIASERRRTLRRDVKTRVRLYNDQTGEYENAHLSNINYNGLYLMTRRKLRMAQEIEIAVPSESDADCIKIKAKVMRVGRHRSWGLFSYACHILHRN